MGQQQMMLVVLVTILVGLATMIAINTFQAAHDEANIDAVRQDILTAHNYSRAYYTKSVQMGGGGGSFSEITMDDILLSEENDNAVYEIIATSGNEFTLSYIPQYRGEVYTVTIRFDEIIWEDK